MLIIKETNRIKKPSSALQDIQTICFTSIKLTRYAYIYLKYSYVVAYQFGNQLLSHGSNEEILLLRESCVDRLRQLQSKRISESIQTTQAHLHLPNNVQGKTYTLYLITEC